MGVLVTLVRFRQCPLRLSPGWSPWPYTRGLHPCTHTRTHTHGHPSGSASGLACRVHTERLHCMSIEGTELVHYMIVRVHRRGSKCVCMHGLAHRSARMPLTQNWRKGEPFGTLGGSAALYASLLVGCLAQPVTGTGAPMTAGCVGSLLVHVLRTRHDCARSRHVCAYM